MGPGPASTWTDAATYVQRVAAALELYDWTAAGQVAEELIVKLNNATERFPDAPARELLSRLRRKRQFDLMKHVADAMIAGGQRSPLILRQYSQSLIDTGDLTAPVAILDALTKDATAPKSEQAEARGLLGRIYKQLYVNAKSPEAARQQANLRTAFGCYFDVYSAQPDTMLWHGINAVALLARAKRDGVPIDVAASVEDMARSIKAAIEAKSQLDSWDQAMILEANVALGDAAGAAESAVLVVSDPAVDAFEVGSLLRQLTEVWELTPGNPPGNEVLPLLQAALLKRQGGGLQMGAAEVKAGLEAVFGQDRYAPFAWFQTGLVRCQAVARIEDKMGRKVGTGFLVDAKEWLGKKSADPVLLTNAHVLSPKDNVFPGSTTPDNAVAIFEASGKKANVKKLIWSSPVSQCDCTFATLDDVDKKALPCPLEPAPEAFAGPGKQRVYVIGYPLGGGLSVSLQDSIWLDTDGTKVHYRTPTEPGSSGSPVFDQSHWSVLALHHMGKPDMPKLHGSGTYPANEGISVQAIQKAFKER